MSLAGMILLMIGAWLLLAAAMLWGLLRLTRRHAPLIQRNPRPMPREIGRAHV